MAEAARQPAACRSAQFFAVLGLMYSHHYLYLHYGNPAVARYQNLK